MPGRRRLALPILVVALAAPPAAPAFDYPLSPESIREAYFLGKASLEKRNEFFEKYTHHLPIPKTGPNVASIAVQTPFGCVVDKVSQMSLSYHAPDAEQDFLGKPGCFRVRVEIYFTETYPDPKATAAALGEFWRNFKLHLKQSAEIQPRSVLGQPIYSDQTISGYIGAEIVAEYDVKKIDPGTSTTVSVNTPDGQDVETTFDLANLR